MNHTNKPVVACVPLWDDEKQSIRMLPEYPNMHEAAGAIPLILPLTTHTDSLDPRLTLYTPCSSPAATTSAPRSTAPHQPPSAAHHAPNATKWSGTS